MELSASLVIICTDCGHLEGACDAAASALAEQATVLLAVDSGPLLADAAVRAIGERLDRAVVHVKSAVTRLQPEALLVATSAVRVERAEGWVRRVDGPPFEALLASVRGDEHVRVTLLADRPQLPDITLLIDDMPIMLVELDANLHFVRHGSGVGGYPSGTLIGRHLWDVAPDYHSLHPVYRRALAGMSADVPGVMIEGRVVDFHYRPIKQGSEVTGVLALGYDVTEREERLRLMQQAIDVLNALPIGVATLRRVAPGPLGYVVERIFYSTRAHLPLAFQAMAGQPAHVVFPRWPQTVMPEVAQRVFASGRSERVEMDYRLPTGEERQLRLHLNAIADDLLVVTLEDISELARTRERAVRAERVEAVGQIAARVAHALNGLLATILMHADLAGETEQVQPHLDAVTAATHRAADLVAQLLAFSRRRQVRPEVITVHQVVQRDEAMLRSILGGGIELHFELAEEPWSVRIDPAALEQVLVNLLHNARDAQPSGGRVVIRVQNRNVDPDLVVVQIIDDGVGMDAETEARCFEPYFTRNAPRSVGMGLSTALVIIEEAGGSISLETEPGRGTCVSLRLPRVAAEVSAVVEDEAAPGPESSIEGPRVLVVDDEDLLRHALARQLERFGYVVELAADGERALALLKGGLEVDLMLCDVVMPGMNGLTLIKHVRSMRPHLRVILMTGYTEHAAVQANPWVAELPLLYKPFKPEVLRRFIEQTLARPAQAS